MASIKHKVTSDENELILIKVFFTIFRTRSTWPTRPSRPGGRWPRHRHFKGHQQVCGLYSHTYLWIFEGNPSPQKTFSCDKWFDSSAFKISNRWEKIEILINWIGHVFDLYLTIFFKLKFCYMYQDTGFYALPWLLM